MPFSYYVMIPVAAGTVSLIAAFILINKKPRSELNIVWFAYLLTIILWAYGEAGIRYVGYDLDRALLFHNLLVVPAGAFMPCIFLHFALIFPVRHPLSEKKYILYLVYFTMSLFVIHAFIRGWSIDSGQLNIIADSYTRESLTRQVGKEVYLLNMAFIAGLIMIGIIILLYNYFKVTGSSQRVQLGVIVFATVFFLGAGFFTDVILPILNVTTMEVASVGAFASAIVVAYILWNLKLEDIALISEKIDTGRIDKRFKDYKVLKGYTYLVPEETVDFSFKLFAREVSNGAHGLLLTSTDPNDIREKYKLKKIPIVWITEDNSANDMYSNDQNVLISKKEDVMRTLELIEKFIKKSTNTVIFLEDLNQLYDPEEPQSDRQAILDAAKNTFRMISDYNSRFIISLHPGSLNIPKGQPILRTKSPILELRLLTIYIVREVFQQVVDAVAVRSGEEVIAKKIHWLRSTDPFFLKVRYQGGKISFLSKKSINRADLIKKVKLFIKTMGSLDRQLDLDSIALRILMKFGFSEYEYYLQIGNSYIIEDEKGDKTFDIFQKFIDSGFEGLCISKTNPEKLLEKYGLVFNTENILWLTDISSETERVVPPKLEHIFMEIENFMEEVPEKKIIILDGIEYLVSYSGDIFNPVLGFLRKLSDKISQTDVILLVPLNFQAIDPQRVSLLERSGLEIVTQEKEEEGQNNKK